MNFVKKIYFGITCFLSIVLCGCGQKEKVNLTVWTPPEDLEIVSSAVEQFQEFYGNDADFSIQIQSEDVAGTKKLLLNKTGAVADVFRFADDQMFDLLKAGVLLPITLDATTIIAENGGADEPVVHAAMKDDKLYGCPATASNGYFLMYNTEYLDDDDVATMDQLLNKCDTLGKNFGMHFSNGWYLYSFFGGAGMSVGTNEDGTHNVCDFNRTDGTYTGMDVVNALQEIISHPSCQDIGNESMVQAAEEFDVIALVSGTWHYNELSRVWNGNIGAKKLPSYTINGKQEQMYSFAGYTYYGVNSETEQPEWAQRMAQWLTNYDTQIKRYEKEGDCPSNVNAAKADAVQSSEMISAFFEQSKYSITQNVLEPYWDPMAILGTYIAAGNPDQMDMQILLDETVSNIQK